LGRPRGKKNQCTGELANTRVTPDVRRLAYTNCSANADVILYTIEGGGHTWPGGEPLPEWIAGRTTNEIKSTTILWDFYVQHPRAPK
jgi:polyhydroxybutyrate depolymerase